MGEERWHEVDGYVGDLLAPHDEALEAALRASAEAGLPEIQVSAPQARLLGILLRSIGARTVLEVGTLGGYSTIWLARALPPGGRLVTLEANSEYAAVAEANLARAGLEGTAEVRAGPALESLAALADEGALEPLDFAFVDADKANSPAYFAWARERARPGALLVVDNVVRGGTLAEADSEDPATRAQRELHEAVAADPALEATTIQTVGVKGYDGFLIARVQAPAAV